MAVQQTSKAEEGLWCVRVSLVEQPDYGFLISINLQILGYSRTSMYRDQFVGSIPINLHVSTCKNMRNIKK